MCLVNKVLILTHMSIHWDCFQKISYMWKHIYLICGGSYLVREVGII